MDPSPPSSSEGGREAVAEGDSSAPPGESPALGPRSSSSSTGSRLVS